MDFDFAHAASFFLLQRNLNFFTLDKDVLYSKRTINRCPAFKRCLSSVISHWVVNWSSECCSSQTDDTTLSSPHLDICVHENHKSHVDTCGWEYSQAPCRIPLRRKKCSVVPRPVQNMHCSSSFWSTQISWILLPQHLRGDLQRGWVVWCHTLWSHFRKRFTSTQDCHTLVTVPDLHTVLTRNRFRSQRLKSL